MNIIIENLHSIAVPVTPDNKSAGGGMSLLPPQESLEIDNADITVVSVGDNPSFLDEVSEAFETFINFLLSWRKDVEPAVEEGTNLVAVRLVNSGTNALRVLADSNTNEVTVEPGTECTIDAKRYVEIRELGV